ncbi:FUSC family protein [Herbaspirillum robiniae]|uniref:FUSC family protein n=1 Tax=Herbaspirillum robiniae TaxID=2014887 RepID=A0A246WVR5_9BURK|nr:FUSC family protein [Herbaspirillum robiniae]NUU00793.1 FUSC family protein [Herbaspirillum robiniae]OWY31169.1 FUSC family protein [Herbaspirillum robiniae]
MEFNFINPRKNALAYLVKILSGCLILWYGLRAAGIEEPYWAMISLIIVTEPDMTVAKANFRARLINTISGCVVSCIALVIFGPTFLAMLVALTAAVVVAMLLQNYPSNWRLGPATVVILLSAAFTGNGLGQELHLAFMRVGEVIVGSTVALLQTVIYIWLVKRKERQDERPSAS